MSQTAITDISAIQGYINKYDKTLINQMLNGLDIAKDLPVIRNVTEPLDLYKMTVDDGARPLNTDIEEAKGGRVWTKRTLTPTTAMKIIKMIPEQLRKTFQSELLDINAKEVPFGQWVWTQEFAKLASEINDNFYYAEHHNGAPTFSAAATYAANALVYFENVIYKNVSGSTTTAGQSPTTHPAKWTDVDNLVLLDGPDKLIRTAIASEGLVAATTGTFSATDGYDYIHEMWGNVTEPHKNKGMVAMCSFDAAQDIATQQNLLFGSGKGIANADVEEGVPFKVRNTGGRLTVKPVTWMRSSRRIIMSNPGNLVLGMNQVSDTSKVGQMIPTLHGYRAIVKWMLGTQFRDLENLYVNDQA
jgi:hypothetical protein